MGRFKVAGVCLPVSLRDLLNEQLCQPRKNNALGVGLAFRGSRLDHFRTYACNGTFRSFAQAYEALQKAWLKTQQELGLPEHLASVKPHTQAFTSLLQKEVELGTIGLINSIESVLKELGVEPTPYDATRSASPKAQGSPRKRSSSSALGAPSSRPKKVCNIGSAAEILWSFSLMKRAQQDAPAQAEPSGAAAADAHVHADSSGDERGDAQATAAHSGSAEVAADALAGPLAGFLGSVLPRLEPQHPAALLLDQGDSPGCEAQPEPVKPRSIDSSATTITDGVDSDADGDASPQSAAASQPLLTSPWQFTDAHKAAVVDVLNELFSSYEPAQLRDVYFEVRDVVPDLEQRGVRATTDLLCSYLHWIGRSYETERARGVTLPNILYSNRAFTFLC